LIQSLIERKKVRNPIWRYYPSTIETMSKRIDITTNNLDYDVFFQIGVGGLPSKDVFKVAHIEIPIQEDAGL